MIEIIIECADCGEMMLIKIATNSKYEDIENIKCAICQVLPQLAISIKK